MLSHLALHPSVRCDAVKEISVAVVRPRSNRLQLQYALTGSLGDLRLPAPAPPARADELWKHTCFEAFVRAGEGSDSYYEFNFAPSTQWAAYHFDGYRTGMRVAEGLTGMDIAIQLDSTRLELGVSLALDRLDLPADGALRLGLSAVIEETNGNKSYWALAHPPGKPDFHHADCFAIELKGASRS
jgi:hypothetical protein